MLLNAVSVLLITLVNNCNIDSYAKKCKNAVRAHEKKKKKK